MYSRLIITTIVGLLTSRFVLQALGASDFGLYAVVGGLISMLNVFSAAMHTTTRRFINVEMGKTNANLNKIFNISRLLHIGFALFIFLIAETIGIYYIYNILNVDSGKINDAMFVFQISTIAAAISIINVPYQALLEAYEKFQQIAIFDIIKSFFMLIFATALIYSHGNTLRIYAIGMSVITLISLLFYNTACFFQWRDIVRYKLYKEKKLYKEILFFNNYVALGATSYLSRTQGSTMLVNYFFGTIVNAAFAIGYAIESHCMSFVTNIGTAAAPQITRNYENNFQRSFYLSTILHRLSVYLMLLLVVPLSLELDFVLRLWLKNVPDGTKIISLLTLLSALARVTFGGLDKIIQASGKIKWFQITGSFIEIASLPLSYILFRIGFPAYTIIIVYIASTIFNSIAFFYLIKKALCFDIWLYIRNVYIPICFVFLGTGVLCWIYTKIQPVFFSLNVIGMIISELITLLVILAFGLQQSEKKIIYNMLTNKIKYRRTT